MRRETLLLATAVLFAGTPALAQTIFKLIDRNGRISYTDTAPKNFDGTVIPVDIDPRGNSAQSPKIPPGGSPPMSPFATQQELTRNEARTRLDQAKERFNAAKDALEQGKEPRDDEWQTLVMQGGQGRRVPTEAFFDRQKLLEENLRRAESDLAAAEQNYRRSN